MPDETPKGHAEQETSDGNLPKDAPWNKRRHTRTFDGKKPMPHAPASQRHTRAMGSLGKGYREVMPSVLTNDWLDKKLLQQNLQFVSMVSSTSNSICDWRRRVRIQLDVQCKFRRRSTAFATDLANDSEIRCIISVLISIAEVFSHSATDCAIWEVKASACRSQPPCAVNTNG